MAGLVDPAAAERWIGRWKGVEGLTLEIAPDPARRPGHYKLTDRYTLDDKGVFDGIAEGDTIVFTRPTGGRCCAPPTARRPGSSISPRRPTA